MSIMVPPTNPLNLEESDLGKLRFHFACGVTTSELLSEIREALDNTHYRRGLQDVTFDIVDDCVLLSGRVRTFFLKQIAQHLASNVAQGLKIRNEIRV